MRALLLGAFLIGCNFHPAAEETPPPEEATAAAQTGTGRGGNEVPPAPACTDELLSRLRITRGGRALHDVSVEAALELPGSVVLDAGRHEGERALPLAAVLAGHPDATALYVELCENPPQRVPREVIDAEPARYAFVANNKGQLKMMDLGGEGRKARRLAKFITKITIEP